jgi:hypothetical protein
MATKTRERRRREVALPEKFEPAFWDSVDNRTVIVREIKRRYETLKRNCGADSIQKDLLCQRATFIG